MEATLNIDLGELPDEPEELYELASIANVACGGHAGDAASIERAFGLAIRAGTRVGAHPSYPDRAGFGRKTMQMEAERLIRSLAAQCALLRAVGERFHRKVTIVKPHGMLYHDAARDQAIARCV